MFYQIKEREKTMANFDVQWSKEQMISMYEDMTTFRKVFLDECNVITDNINKFNGKVLNVRFATAVNEVANPTTNLRLIVKSLTRADNKEMREKNCLEAQASVYDDEQRRTFKLFGADSFCIYTDENKRILANETKQSMENMIAKLDKRIAEFKDGLDNYDKYYQQVINMRKSIAEYNDTRNFYLCPYIWVQCSF